MRGLHVTSFSSVDDCTFEHVVWYTTAIEMHGVSATSQYSKNSAFRMLAYFYKLAFDIEKRFYILIVCDCMGKCLFGSLTPVPCEGNQEYFLPAIFPRPQ